MLLPAAGLIIAAAPATERRRCRGRPPAVPALHWPPLRIAPPGRHPGSPPRNSSSKHLFSCAAWNSVTKKAVFWLPMGVAERSVTKKGGFWLPMGFADSSVTKKGGFWLRMGCGDAWGRRAPAT